MPILENLQEHSAFAVRSHDVRLHFEAIVDMRNIAYKSHHAILHFDRDVV